MGNKCNKYEAFFVFSKDEDFQEHLNSCPDCQEEHLKMLKISSLIKEVRPLYLGKERNSKIAKLVAVLLLMVFCTGFVTIQIYNEKYNNLVTAQESVVAKMGLPYDEYGLLSVE